MAALFTWKLQGQTDADAEIDTNESVEYWGDGSFRFTVNGVSYIYSGNDAAVNALLGSVFTGTGGLATTTRLFGHTGANV